MLSRFSVKGFKNFKDEFIIDFNDIHDYKFNEHCIKNGFINKMIIYGKNAVGKSNLGYAIFDIMCHLTDNHFTIGVYDNYLNANSEVDYAEFKYEFKFENNIVKYHYKKTNNRKLLYEELFIDNQQIFEYDFKEKTGAFDGLGIINAETLNFDFKDENLSVLRYIANNSDFEINSPVRMLMTFVSKMLLFKSLSNNHFSGYTSNVENIVSYFVENDLVDEFEHFLNANGVDGKIVAKENPTGEKMLYFNFKKPIPFNRAASHGTLALAIFFYWYKHFEDVSFLFIDEFDAFYHFELSRNIVQILNSNNHFQTILTSHNTEIISNRLMRPDCFFIMTDEKIVSFVHATERELREGHNLEKLFKSGEFNG